MKVIDAGRDVDAGQWWVPRAIQLLPFAAAVARIPNLRIMSPASGTFACQRPSICLFQRDLLCHA